MADPNQICQLERISALPTSSVRLRGRLLLYQTAFCLFLCRLCTGDCIRL